MSLIRSSASSQPSSILWKLVDGSAHVEPSELFDAIEQQIAAGDLDFRTRLLIRDALHALNDRCGEEKMTQWRARSKARRQIDAILVEELGAPGFPFLGRLLMDVTKAENADAASSRAVA